MDIMKTKGIPIICDVRGIGIIFLTLVRIKWIQEVKEVVK